MQASQDADVQRREVSRTVGNEEIRPRREKQRTAAYGVPGKERMR